MVVAMRSLECLTWPFRPWSAREKAWVEGEDFGLAHTCEQFVRFRFVRRVFVRIASPLLFLGMVWPASVAATEPVSVFVSIVPQKYFVDKIGGERVKVSVMVRPGANPATYEPRPHQMVALSGAKIYYAIGVPFEKRWLEKIAAVNPRIRVVHTEEGIEKRPMKGRHHEGGDQEDRRKEKGEDAGEDHGIMDPHIWLSPPLVKFQARNILNGLLSVDPAHRTLYEANFERFSAELDALDRDIRGVFARRGEKVAFMVFHPAWGYFAQTYGLEQIPVEIEGKEPRADDLKRLIHHARERGIKVVFVQPEFSTKSAQAIAQAIGGQIVFASPLAPDWASNLKEVAAKFEAALR